MRDKGKGTDWKEVIGLNSKKKLSAEESKEG